MDQLWFRTCQECMAKRKYKSPYDYAGNSLGNADKNDAWRNVKCRACKSDALDFGSTEYADRSVRDDEKEVS